MKIDKLTVELDVKVNIPDETVMQCLRLIELWLNANADKAICGGDRRDDGTIEPFEIVQRFRNEPYNE